VIRSAFTETTTGGFPQEPADFQAHQAGVNNGIMNTVSYSMVVGAGDGNVSFYRANGTIATISYRSLLNHFDIR